MPLDFFQHAFALAHKLLARKIGQLPQLVGNWQRQAPLLAARVDQRVDLVQARPQFGTVHAEMRRQKRQCEVKGSLEGSEFGVNVCHAVSPISSISACRSSRVSTPSLSQERRRSRGAANCSSSRVLAGTAKIANTAPS